jgi:hypothetical protein
MLSGAALPVYSLTIVPTFDSSIANDPGGAAMQAAIQEGISVIQSKIADDLTVAITFVNDPKTELGASNTSTADYAYAEFLAKLKSKVSSADDAQAVNSLPDSANEPVRGGSQINLTSALARLLGLSGDLPPEGDSTVTLNMAAHNLTRSSKDPQKYDLQSTVEHELDEVLGVSSNLNDGNVIGPMDLFRYDSNGQRNYTTTGDNAYFSLDGTALLARFNQDPSGDYQDWWSLNGQFWSPPGTTPSAQVQDAFGATGSFQDLGPNEWTALDVIGYTLTGGAPPVLPTLSMVRSGAGQLTLSWPQDAAGYVLQESANLAAGSWADTTAGSANPAVIQADGAQKFYRLSKPAPQALAQVNLAPIPLAQAATPRIKTHVLRPRRP